MLRATLPTTSITTLFQNIHTLFNARLDDGRPVPTMLYGDPGISKTQQVYNTLVPKLGALTGKRVHVLHENLATMEPTDLRGIPFPVKPSEEDAKKKRRAASVWTRPDLQDKIERILDADPDAVIILLLDEYGQAQPDTKKAAVPMFAEGRLGDYKLPGNVWIWGTSNFQDSGAGVTKSFSHELSRMYHFNVVLKMEDWISDFALPNELPPAAVLFAERHAALFEGRDADYTPAPDSPRCNYRSYTYAMNALSAIKESQGDTDPRTVPTDQFTKLTLSGLIGVEIAEKFLAIAPDLHKLPDPSLIVRDWENAPLPSGPDAYLQYPLQSLLIQGILSASATSDSQEALVNYATRLRPPLAAAVLNHVHNPAEGRSLLTPVANKFIANHASLFTALSEAKRG